MKIQFVVRSEETAQGVLINRLIEREIPECLLLQPALLEVPWLSGRGYWLEFTGLSAEISTEIYLANRGAENHMVRIRK